MSERNIGRASVEIKAEEIVKKLQRQEIRIQHTLESIRAKDAVAQEMLDTLQDKDAQILKTANSLMRQSDTLQSIIDSIKQNSAEAQAIFRSIEKINIQVDAVANSLHGKDTQSQEILRLLETKISDMNESAATAQKDLAEITKTIKGTLGNATAAGLTGAFVQIIDTKEKQNQKRWWLAGAGIFLALAIAAAIFLGYTVFSDADASIVGFFSKISITGLAVAGAWFCGSQYLRIENTLEDYRYKKVLAQSIPAFMEKLETNQEANSAFLKILFTQMLQDPLRKKHDAPTLMGDMVSAIKNVATKEDNSADGT